MFIKESRYRYLFIVVLVASLFFMVFLFRQSHSLGLLNFLVKQVGVVFNSQGESENKVIFKAEKTLRILEGWTTSQIGEYLEGQELWSQAQWLMITGQTKTFGKSAVSSSSLVFLPGQFNFLQDKPIDQGLEGYLFPDTYRVHASSTPEEIVAVMLNNFDKKLTPQMRTDIKKQGRSIHEIITMASLIEKEAPISYKENADNRDAYLISGIFWKRLAIGQALQSDATLSYILNDNKSSHSGSELELESLYNTYKYRGLPPGPICNPGLLAIHAAIYPLESDYYYFLTPTAEKIVVYGRDYNEHLRNKYKYLK